jgi:ribosome-binding protein aMBF1 (putative translation factor)
MSGHHKFSQLTEHFSEERRAEINKQTAQLKAEMALGELRQALQLSQTELAAKLKAEQSTINLAEKQTDIYVNHLREVIEAMGGELNIIARFPDGEVKIDDLSELIDLSTAQE